MAETKNYFTVNELIALCQNLNLDTSGTKSELIDRLQYYQPQSEISRVSICRARISPVSTIDQSTQFPEETLSLNVNRSSNVEKCYQWFTKIAIWIGLFGGFYALSQFFVGFENIPVKRSWF